jgi:hypothetical protein
MSVKEMEAYKKTTAFAKTVVKVPATKPKLLTGCFNGPEAGKLYSSR